jgi:hypothetical protein
MPGAPKLGVNRSSEGGPGAPKLGVGSSSEGGPGAPKLGVGSSSEGGGLSSRAPGERSSTAVSMYRAAGPSPSRHSGAMAFALVLFLVGGAVAMSVDVPRTAYGIKGDEATYIATALSAAYDGNLSFERRDLERFAGLYHSGPEGIFLKRGQIMHLRMGGGFPWVHVDKTLDPRIDRLYFGKSLIYPLFAAPFVRFFGLNGVLLFHAVLLAVVFVCGYMFLAARSSTPAALLLTTAFLGASTLPPYVVFLTPEVFNFALVFVAYFLWLYREVAPETRFSGSRSQIAAAVLLGLVTYSKLSHVLLIAPLVLLAWWRREWTRGFLVGVVCVAVAALWFGLTGVVSGDFNYQGGGQNRRTFYTKFPFDSPQGTWDTPGYGGTVATDGSAAVNVLNEGETPIRFLRNLKYFFVGRHFGFVPYFFPGLVIVAAWLLSSARRDRWRVLTFGAFAASALGLLLITPYTWSGGGGPAGNRYLLSIYAVLFFLAPPMHFGWPGILSWAGGALFTAKMLMNPFVVAKFTYTTMERGPLRRLPVELTMVNDLPINLDASRAHIPYRNDPFMLLYFLDQNAFPPEPPGMWVSGGGRADIVVRTVDPVDHLAVSAESPISTRLSVSAGARTVTVQLTPGKVETFDVPTSGVHYVRSYAYLMSVRSTEGFVPHVFDPASKDYRNLGALMRFQAISSPQQ